MNTKIVYSYHGQTGEYTGLCIAYESPLEPDIYHIPANATEISPPETNEYEIPVWNGETWIISEDWRGLEGYINGNFVKIEEIGPLPEEWSDTPRPLSLAEAKAAKKAEYADMRWSKETSGVLFRGMQIDTSREAQALIAGIALQAIVDSDYSCQWKTSDGFVVLDAATILEMAAIVRMHVQSCFDREAELLAAVEAAKSMEEVQAISWNTNTEEEK